MLKETRCQIVLGFAVNLSVYDVDAHRHTLQKSQKPQTVMNQDAIQKLVPTFLAEPRFRSSA